MIGRRVRQGRAPSSLLLNLYDEAMMRDAVTDVDIGVKVGDYTAKSVRFADNKVIVARSEKKSTGTITDNIVHSHWAILQVCTRLLTLHHC